MMPERPILNLACTEALEAIERDPLELPGPVEVHLDGCLACSEARVLLLALEDAPMVAVPHGYFEGLGYRLMRKLPGRVTRLRRGTGFWLAAAGLLAALGLGATGFFMGRAVNPPTIEASQPRNQVDSLDQQVETPFYESEDLATHLTDLSPKEAESALKRLQTNPPAQSGQ